jgi:hypothetical protein
MPNNQTYPENVKAFLSEIKDSVEEPKEIDGFLFIAVRKTVAEHIDSLISLRKTAFLIAERLSLKPFLEFSLCNSLGKPAFQIAIALMYKTAEIISGCNSQIKQAPPEDYSEKEHVDRLKSAFQKVSADQITESIKFLLDHGWTDARLMKEFRISSVTLWRYKNRNQPGQSQTSQLGNGESAETGEAPTPN